MKFWEWWIFTSGLLCILSADSSIGWCAVLAIACLFGIIMRQFADDVQAETKRSMAVKGAYGVAEKEEWVRHCESKPIPEEVTIWEEYQ